jgi:hypothetical protein
MTEHNHHRGTRRKRGPTLTEKEFTIHLEGRDPEVITRIHAAEPLHNGYRPRNGKPWGFLDKSLHGWGRKSVLADRTIGAGIGNDFSDGARGMAHAVKGAKKFVRSRLRFHENAVTRRLAQEATMDLQGA